MEIFLTVPTKFVNDCRVRMTVLEVGRNKSNEKRKASGRNMELLYRSEMVMTKFNCSEIELHIKIKHIPKNRHILENSRYESKQDEYMRRSNH